MNSKAFMVVLLLGIEAEARFQLNEEARECAEKSKVSEEGLEAFVLNQELLQYDAPELRNFVACLFAEDYDGNHQLIINERTLDDIADYYSSFITGNNTIVRALAKDAAENCKAFSGKSTVGESVFLVGNCIRSILRDYIANLPH